MTMKCGVFLYDSACLSVPLVTMKSGRAAAPCHIWYVVGGYKQLNRSTPVLRNNSTKNCCWLAADRMHACPCPPYYILVLWPVVGIHRVYIQLVTRCWQFVGDNYVPVVVVVLFIYNNNCKIQQTTQGRQRKPTSLAERVKGPARHEGLASF